MLWSLQGEVEQIALMKPKAQTEHGEGMLEFLEDIVGTSVLKEPIQALDKQVEELGEERGEKVRCSGRGREVGKRVVGYENWAGVDGKCGGGGGEIG